MSIVKSSDISSILATVFEKDIEPLVNRSAPMLQVLPAQEMIGKTENWAIQDSDGRVDGYASAAASGETVTVYNDDAVTNASLPYSIMQESFGVAGDAIAAAASNGENAVLNLFGEKLKWAVSRLSSNIAREIYSGHGDTLGGVNGDAQTIAGMLSTNGALKATGTYAGVNKSSHTLFAGNELLNSSTPRDLTLNLLDSVWRTMYTSCGEPPEVVFCSPKQWAKLSSLLTALQTFRNEQTAFNVGAPVLMFHGVPIYQDVNCPDGQMVFLRITHQGRNNVCILQNTQGVFPNMASSARIALKTMGESQFDGGDVPGVSFRINQLAQTGDAFKFQLIAYVNLRVRRPNACAILGDLTTSYSGL